MRRQRPDTRGGKRPKTQLRVGDTVQLMTGDGSEDRPRGQITEILTGQQMVRVSGVRIQTKHRRQGGRSRTLQQQSGRIQLPGKIHWSNVMPVCPSCDQPTRVRHEGTGLDKRRICAKCGGELPKPAPEE